MRTTVLSLIVIFLIVGAAAMVVGVAAEDRPTERVTPAPLGNPNAVIWRTPEPPSDPQKCDVWINPKDNMPMVYIAPGESAIGSSNSEIEKWLEKHPEDQYDWFAQEQPQCKVTLKGYWIGRFEVTNAQYLRFVQATDHDVPDHWHGRNIPNGLEDFPVVFVTWDDAAAYCAWAGGRLPTELEWEKAARGSDKRTFPWGFEWDWSRCRNMAALIGRITLTPEENAQAIRVWTGKYDEVRQGPVAVGTYKQGASPYGCYEMAGNVWEWCADCFNGNAYQRFAKGDLRTPDTSQTGTRVLRGGAYTEGHPRAFRCAYRYSAAPDRMEAFIGFRCARNAGK
jgi:sulfatase modifying factor 1